MTLLFKIVTGLVATFFSGIMLCGAFPSFDLPALAWVALVPLLLTLTRCKPLSGFFLSFFFGIVFFAGIFNWIFELPKYSLLHHVILGAYLGPLLGLFGLGFCLIGSRRSVTMALFSAPFLWVTLEYIRSHLSFLALPWGLLAHSQYRQPMLIQFAAITGALGVSFVIVLINSGIAALVYPFLPGSKTDRISSTSSLSRKGRTAVLVTATVTFCMVVLYGYRVTSRPLTGEKLKISLVQANIEQAKKWDQQYAPEIMNIYTELTRLASRDGPALIVWPETATPRAINRDPRLLNQVRQIARSAGTYLLLGSSQLQKFKVTEPKKVKYFNSAFLIPPETETNRNQRYDKIRLLPFGEYLPYKDKIPWS